MSSAKLGFQYNNTLNVPNTPADYFSDMLLGTNNRQNNANLAFMNEQNRFNEYMSNTAAQRGVADLVQAGINPMVLFSGGSAGSAKASVPSSSGGSAGLYDARGGLVGNGILQVARSTAKALNSMSSELSSGGLEVLKALV